MRLEFSILRFTPDPEEVEPVNAALVMWDRRPRLLVDSKFHRVACLSPGIDRDGLRAYLQHLEEEVLPESDPASLPDALRARSAQFVATEPRRVAAPSFDVVESFLLARYLGHGAPRRPRRAVGEKQASTLLERFLQEKLHVSKEGVLRRASPSTFLSPEAYQRLPGNGFKISRVLVSNRALVLIDALKLESRRADAVEDRARHVASAFYRLGKIKDDVQHIDGRSMYRATVLFGQVDRSSEESGKLEFACELVRRESDAAVSSDESSAGLSDLRERVREAADALI